MKTSFAEVFASAFLGSLAVVVVAGVAGVLAWPALSRQVVADLRAELRAQSPIAERFL